MSAADCLLHAGCRWSAAALRASCLPAAAAVTRSCLTALVVVADSSTRAIENWERQLRWKRKDAVLVAAKKRSKTKVLWWSMDHSVAPLLWLTLILIFKENPLYNFNLDG
jgi:hypothetical protein